MTGTGERRAVLGIGGNQGDVAAALQGAVDLLFAPGSGLRPVAVSPVYETAPVGGPEQDRFLNAVVIGATALAPRAVLGIAQSAEQAFHRERIVRWGPRTLDVDVIAVDGTVADDPELTLPHPRAHERAFVLRPWADADPDAVLPGRGRVADLLAALGGQDVRRCTDLELRAPAEPD